MDVLYWRVFVCKLEGEMRHLVDIRPDVRVWLQHVTWREIGDVNA